MLGLLGDHPPCLLFEQLFLERLPEDIRIQLVNSKIEDHCQLAKHADTLWSSREMECNTNAVQRRPHGQKIKAPLEKFSVPQHRFDHIHVDLVGPLPPSNGFTHLLTVVDRFSRWPEAIPLNDTTATSCAQALVFHWIARFGIPIDMSSDRGPQFTSQLWKSIAQLLGTQLHHTTAYTTPNLMAWWRGFTVILSLPYEHASQVPIGHESYLGCC